MSKILCFDYDAICFRAATATQKTSILCKNKATGEVHEFKTRTDFYGHYKKKAGGWLSKQFGVTLDDFEIEDVVDVQSPEATFAAVNNMIADMLSKFGTTNYYGYVGGESNFRKEICTLMPYKGQRTAALPANLAAAKEFVVYNHNAKVSDGVESDDMISMDNLDAFKKGQDFVAIIQDKDYKGCDGQWYYFLNSDLRIVKGFGELYRVDNGDIDGSGRMFKYFQVCRGDTSDNYIPHYWSEQENGEVTAYNALKDCKNDTEAFLAMKEHFQYLYPEPKEITNWRGDTFTIDWFYVMNEMFQLAHLRRWKDDTIDLRKAFQGLKIEI